MTPADRVMPVIDAYPVPALRGDHYRALFPDGERTYPSRESMQRAGLRVGAAIRFHSDPSLRPRSATRASSVSRGVSHGAAGGRDDASSTPAPEPVTAAGAADPPSAGGTPSGVKGLGSRPIPDAAAR